ncbi:MAG: hypothetical protein K1X83_11770 [Oligoflexia bacterium]|nr:hypothetical protein [Oligoflexia bacterium]
MKKSLLTCLAPLLLYGVAFAQTLTPPCVPVPGEEQDCYDPTVNDDLTKWQRERTNRSRTSEREGIYNADRDSSDTTTGTVGHSRTMEVVPGNAYGNGEQVSEPLGNANDNIRNAGESAFTTEQLVSGTDAPMGLTMTTLSLTDPHVSAAAFNAFSGSIDYGSNALENWNHNLRALDNAPELKGALSQCVMNLTSRGYNTFDARAICEPRNTMDVPAAAAPTRPRGFEIADYKWHVKNNLWWFILETGGGGGAFDLASSNPPTADDLFRLSTVTTLTFKNYKYEDRLVSAATGAAELDIATRHPFIRDFRRWLLSYVGDVRLTFNRPEVSTATFDATAPRILREIIPPKKSPKEYLANLVFEYYKVLHEKVKTRCLLRAGKSPFAGMDYDEGALRDPSKYGVPLLGYASGAYWLFPGEKASDVKLTLQGAAVDRETIDALYTMFLGELESFGIYTIVANTCDRLDTEGEDKWSNLVKRSKDGHTMRTQTVLALAQQLAAAQFLTNLMTAVDMSRSLTEGDMDKRLRYEAEHLLAGAAGYSDVDELRRNYEKVIEDLNATLDRKKGEARRRSGQIGGSVGQAFAAGGGETSFGTSGVVGDH